MNKKWIYEGNILFPLTGELKIEETIPNGVYQVTTSEIPDNNRLGLKLIDTKFKFNYKLYDIDFKNIIKTILYTWSSESFIKQKRDLGVIFSGLKGTGKTIAAKVLCNAVGLPIIIVPDNIKGIVEFIHDIDFECVIFIDEAEKLFNEDEGDGDILLRLVESSYNKSRKLYILTTNNLDINDNLLGRPGRIRYIKQFGNLSLDIIKEYINDNLNDRAKEQEVLDMVNSLEFSTIDILKCIIDEFNIYGDIDKISNILNIPKSSYMYKVIEFNDIPSEDLVKRIDKFISNISGNINSWLSKKSSDGRLNKDIITEELNCYFDTYWSKSGILKEGSYVDDYHVIVKADQKRKLYIMKRKYQESSGSLIMVLEKIKTADLYSTELF